MALQRLYLDEDLSNDLGPALRAVGCDAVHTRELGRDGQIDPKQLAFAATQRRTLVTANFGDFRMLYEAWLTWTALDGPGLPTHPGIVVVPNPNSLLVAPMTRVLDDFAQRTEPFDIEHRLVRWSAKNGWQDFSAVR